MVPDSGRAIWELVTMFRRCGLVNGSRLLDRCSGMGEEEASRFPSCSSWSPWGQHHHTLMLVYVMLPQAQTKRVKQSSMGINISSFFCLLSLVPATATQSWLTCHHTDSTSSFQGLRLLFIHASNSLFAAIFFKGLSSESVVSEMTLIFKVKKKSHAYNWFIKPIFFTIYCI